MARSVWDLVDENIVEHLCNSTIGNAREFIFNMIDILVEHHQVKCFVTLWAIWYAKRKVIHEDKYQSHFSTYAFLYVFIQSFISDLESAEEVHKKKLNHVRRTNEVRTSWSAPPNGVIKINVDADVAKNLNKGAELDIARSSTKLYMGASVVIFHSLGDPKMLEALAC
jgi:hypothetical protein